VKGLSTRRQDTLFGVILYTAVGLPVFHSVMYVVLLIYKYNLRSYDLNSMNFNMTELAQVKTSALSHHVPLWSKPKVLPRVGKTCGISKCFNNINILSEQNNVLNYITNLLNKIKSYKETNLWRNYSVENTEAEQSHFTRARTYTKKHRASELYLLQGWVISHLI
jgi:hypothetical protein